MYYLEKIINGVLMCKTSPDGEWIQVSIEENRFWNCMIQSLSRFEDNTTNIYLTRQ